MDRSVSAGEDDRESVLWRGVGDLPGVGIMEARFCARSWHLFHETYAFCSVYAIHSPTCARLRYRRWDFDATPSTVQAFEPGEVQMCDANSGVADYDVLLIDSRIFAEASESGQFPHFSAPMLEGAFPAFQALHQTLRNPSLDALHVECAFQRTLDTVLLQGEGERRPALSTSPSVKRARECAEDVLASRLDDRIALDVLAQAGKVSKFTLCREFVRELGATPAQYVTLRRFARSLRLLRDGRSVRRVAIECGYSEEAFCRKFRSLYGTTPGRYQRGHRVSPRALSSAKTDA